MNAVEALKLAQEQGKLVRPRSWVGRGICLQFLNDAPPPPDDTDIDPDLLRKRGWYSKRFACSWPFTNLTFPIEDVLGEWHEVTIYDLAKEWSP